MRKIKFRGKPVENYGETKWLYGSVCLNYIEKVAYIESPYQGSVAVQWDSVGQYIGLQDTTTWATLTEKEREEWVTRGNMPSEWKGKEIYEGDLLEHEMEVNGVWEPYQACEVVYNQEEAMFNFKNDGENMLNGYRNMVVVGNIHDI